MRRCGISSKKYICIVPSKEFQVRKYAERTWRKIFLRGCKDPDIAFYNWMERDYLFGRYILDEAKKWLSIPLY